VDSASLFCEDYHADRAAFERVLAAFTARSGRSMELHRYSVDASADLSVTAALLHARRPQRLLVLVTGIHGVEGYAGAAVVRLLLSELLLGTDAETTGLLVVHALNPYGFAHKLRVNRNNVDLNRNCAQLDADLMCNDDSAYAELASVLSPKRPARVGRAAHAQFALRMLRTRSRIGDKAVRQATLGGQYSDALGVFWGGDRVQPEIRFFQGLYERLAAQYPELLLIDLHTGYGDRGQAYALFGRTDTPSIAACTQLGVQSAEGRELSYDVFGDLVQYCYAAAKRLQPAGVFDGLALEVGTHGLSMLAQLQDLYTVVLENQTRHHGLARTEHEATVQRAFRELFFPSDSSWRAQILRNCLRAISNLLMARGFISRG
jgi:Protein of unknown function (DUF2817)